MISCIKLVENGLQMTCKLEYIITVLHQIIRRFQYLIKSLVNVSHVFNSSICTIYFMNKNCVHTNMINMARPPDT